MKRWAKYLKRAGAMSKRSCFQWEKKPATGLLNSWRSKATAKTLRSSSMKFCGMRSMAEELTAAPTGNGSSRQKCSEARFRHKACLQTKVCHSEPSEESSKSCDGFRGANI